MLPYFEHLPGAEQRRHGTVRVRADRILSEHRLENELGLRFDLSQRRSPQFPRCQGDGMWNRDAVQIAYARSSCSPAPRTKPSRMHNPPRPPGLASSRLKMVRAVGPAGTTCGAWCAHGVGQEHPGSRTPGLTAPERRPLEEGEAQTFPCSAEPRETHPFFSWLRMLATHKLSQNRSREM